MKTTKINSGKRQQVQPDLQGLGNQEPDMMNQLPDKNRENREEDIKNKTGKASDDKGKQDKRMPDMEKGKQKK
jgi:hypothetical protein